MTLLSLFHSQERFATAHLYFEKKLMFYEEMRIFNLLFPNSKLWPPGVGASCSLRTI